MSIFFINQHIDEWHESEIRRKGWSKALTPAGKRTGCAKVCRQDHRTSLCTKYENGLHLYHGVPGSDDRKRSTIGRTRSTHGPSGTATQAGLQTIGPICDFRHGWIECAAVTDRTVDLRRDVGFHREISRGRSAAKSSRRACGS